MEQSDKIKIIEQAYDAALDAGLVRNKGDFAELVGVNRSALSCAMNGNEKYLTDGLIAKIRGFSIAPKTLLRDEILVIPTGARAGTLCDFAESIKAYDCEKIISPIKGADYAIQVTGDSMSPEYPSGSHIIIKQVNEAAFIEWGKVYVLDTENGAVIKKIHRTEQADEVKCVSINPAYESFNVNTKYIKGWYRVLMCLSLK